MKINELVVKNYRVFYGEHRLSFDQGNVFLIRGRNGYGKSTLVNAILYALYGEEKEGDKLLSVDNSKLLSGYAKLTGDEHCEVSLCFEHAGNRYRVTRGVEDGLEKYVLWVNGKESPEKFQDIIPERVALLSFFDGEEIARLLGTLTPQAMETLLGVSKLKRARDDVKFILKRIERSRSLAYRLRRMFALALGREKSLTREKKELEKAIKEEKKEHRLLRHKIDKLELLLQEARFRKELPYLVLRGELNHAIEKIARRKDRAVKARIEQGKLQAQQELLRGILRSRKCICGGSLSTSQYGRYEIEKLLHEIASKEHATRHIPLEVYSQSSQELGRALEKINSLPRFERLIGKGPIGRGVEKSLEDAKVESRISKLKLEELMKKLDRVNKRLKSKRKIEKSYLERLRLALDEVIESEIWKGRTDIERESSSLLTSITNKPQEFTGLEVGEGYEVGIKGSNASLSNGENQVAALSFLAGLKKELLVIDAPFTRLDAVHKKKLIRRLPELAEQVILLVTDKDLSRKEIKRLADKAWYLKHIQSIKSSRIKEACD